MARRWDAQSLRHLLDGIGSYGIRWFQRKTNTPGDYEGAKRSRQAIYNAALRLCGPGGLTRGAFTLRRLIKFSGFTRSQLFRARYALKQKWKRLGPRGAYLITEDQVDEAMEWLKHDYWSREKHLYCCLSCHTETRPHHSLGLCRRCYFQYRRRCQSYGLPTDQDILFSRISGLGADNAGIHDKVLEAVLIKLKRGHALSGIDLEWIYTLL